MPELPEVEYTARQLRKSVVGATIQEVQVFWPRIVGCPDVETLCAEIAGRNIEGIRRRGKFLLMDLSGGYLLSIHRRMTGNFLLLPPGWQVDTSLRERDTAAWNVKGPTFVPPVDRELHFIAPAVVDGTARTVEITTGQKQATMLVHTMYCRACFRFGDGRYLLFTDPRKFGRIELWPREREAQIFATLGPEPLSADFTVERFQMALAQHRTSIKATLLAQEVIAGIGNIYADEALFYAGVHPLRPANSLNVAEVARLHEGIIVVLERGIEHGGTSFNDYRDLWGEAGDNYNHVRVYQRAGLPCVTCGTPIERIIVTQRSTHYCPSCQPRAAQGVTPV